MSRDWGVKDIEAGQDLEVTGEVFDKNGNPLDITGWAMGLWALERGGDDAFSQTSGFTFPATNQWHVVLQRSLTVDRGGRSYKVDVWRAELGANTVLSKGIVNILEVARPTS